MLYFIIWAAVVVLLAYSGLDPHFHIRYDCGSVCHRSVHEAARRELTVTDETGFHSPRVIIGAKTVRQNFSTAYYRGDIRWEF